ncbi:hypothetical protein PS6_006780 [Mucor atramentarius]
MWLKPTNASSKFSIMPDLDDPNFYCCLPRVNSKKAENRKNTVHCAYCDYTYSSIYTYNSHCKNFHKLEYPSTDSKTNEFPDLNNPDFYCNICDIAYMTKFLYKQHCRVKHDMKTESNPHEVPDALDPNNYCRACNKTLKSKIAYRKHLFIIHNLNFASLANNSEAAVSEKGAAVKPDVEDPDHYCCVCKRKYTSRSSYIQHIESVHKMTVNPSSLSDPKSLPDPMDPDFYCRICDVTESSMETYRNHCKFVHHMALDPSINTLLNPGAVIDVASPDLYCAQCDYYFSFRNSFESHLRSTHNLG